MATGVLPAPALTGGQEIRRKTGFLLVSWSPVQGHRLSESASRCSKHPAATIIWALGMATGVLPAPAIARDREKDGFLLICSEIAARADGRMPRRHTKATKNTKNGLRDLRAL